MPTARERDAWSQSPFDAAAVEGLRKLIAGLGAEQRFWLSGYLAGAAAAVDTTAPHAVADPQQRAALTILFGSQSGNCERVAKLLYDKLRERQIEATLLDMIDCRKSHLQAAKTLIVIVSTHGDGEPPERALSLHELVHGPKLSRLDHLRFCVLALGDSSYEKFCETGRQFDARLQALGAKRMREREECDVEFEMPARRWIDDVLTNVSASTAGAPVTAEQPAVRIATVSTAYTRRNPFQAGVLVNQRLTGRQSSKDVRHIELSLEGSHIRYEPGDAIGVVPRNRENSVDAVIEAAGFDAEAPVRMDSQTVALRQALLDHFDIGLVSPAFLERYAAAIGSPLSMQSGSLVDVLRAHPPAALTAADFAQLLRPLAPRLYSIASSQRANTDEAHLTVSVVEHGVVSTFLGDLRADGANAPIYLHRNGGFRLPTDPRISIVMIAAGTGVAPYRSFLAEREAVGAPGRHWLIFGDRHFETDFLYQTEWLEARARGTLQRIDVAFSRDQADKVYVQDRLRDNGADLWAWLQEGAHLYLCGDATRMAPDVHEALLEIARTHGALTEEGAIEYIAGLQRNRRYQKDVY